MAQDNTTRAYELADEWISMILSTNPEALITKPNPSRMPGNGKPVEFDFESTLHSARVLAEFRQQLGNALAAQHFPAESETS